MTNRLELIEAALDILPDGIALTGEEGQVALWNRAAEALTGRASSELLGRSVKEALETLVVGGARQWTIQTDAQGKSGRGSLVHMRHRLGHELPVIARILVLRDGLGGRIGSAVVFHPAARLDALPHPESSQSEGVEASQADLEDRLDAEFQDFVQGNLTFGVLWVNVDQAHELRKTHGERACQAMLEKVERSLSTGLRPGEEVGRWGDDEFLVISHERTPEMLAEHAQALAGLARTADFRWWGDRVSITVSIGAAQAEESEPLADLLKRAQEAMVTSMHTGGNHITLAPGGLQCLRS
jgi:diguanylate cyclase (GGDEF)-like protein/PAS domain S-box-containing protein